MTSSSTIEVKVVFDAASRGRRGAVRVTPHTRAEGARSWHALGFVHLLVAAALYYGIWWRVDPFLYMTLMMKTPVDVDMSGAGQMFGLPADSAAAKPPPQSARAGQVFIGSTVYGWLTLSTVSFCTLALAAGASWGRFRAGGFARSAMWFAMLVAGALALAAFLEWRSYGAGYPPRHLRIGMGGVVLLFAAIGLIMGRFARGLGKLAAVTLIVAAIGTSVALYLGSRQEAIEPPYATASALAVAFAIHSGYGWLTLLLLRWIR